MPLKIENKREDRRYALPADLGAEIEFEGPDGRCYRLPLLQISGLGLAFCLPEPVPGIEGGVTLADVQILVGSLVIRGHLAVQHTLRDHLAIHKCGAHFYPASDADRNELVSLLSRLDSLSQLRRS